MEGGGDKCALRYAHLCLCLFSTARDMASFPVCNVFRNTEPHTVRNRVLSPIK